MVVESGSLISGVHWVEQERIASNLTHRLAHVRIRESQIPQNPPTPTGSPLHVQDARGESPESGCLIPDSVSVNAQLIQDTARVSLKQCFVNNSNNRIPQASYTFPLPHGCSVFKFICRFDGGRVLKGKIKPREAAQTAFEETIARDQPAGLLDHHTTEVFTTSLGSIPPNSRLEVEISFLTLLKYSFDQGHGLTVFTIPNYIAPRYGAAPGTLRHNEPSSSSPRHLNIQIDVLAAEEITSISSHSHAVAVETGVGNGIWQRWSDFVGSRGQNDSKCARVRLSDNTTNLDRDFVLHIQTRPEQGLDFPHASVEEHSSYDNHRAVMLTIPERFMLRAQTQVTAAEIIFVLDRSGSMANKIDVVKSAMNFFLRGIPQGKYFNVWSFGSEYESIWTRSVPYSERTLQEALSYVSRNCEADMGGTELLPVLSALAAGGVNFQTTDIVVLTDGQVWNLEGTLEFVRRTRLVTEGSLRLFSLGIGDAVSHALVEGLARAGGGYSEVVSSISQAGLESRVVAVLQATLSNHIGPIRLEIDNGNNRIGPRPGDGQQVDENSPSLTRDSIGYLQLGLKSPVDAATLSPFVRNRVFILYENLDPSIQLTGIRLKASRPDGGEISELVQINTLEGRDSMIHRFAARALLGDLEYGQSRFHIGRNALPRNSIDQATAIRSEGERLGCKWSLVSKWTSFFAVEESLQDTSQVDILADDEGNPAVESVDQEDPGLLRPRGPRARVGWRLSLARNVSDNSTDESSDGDEDEDDDESEGDDEPEDEDESGDESDGANERLPREPDDDGEVNDEDNSQEQGRDRGGNDNDQAEDNAGGSYRVPATEDSDSNVQYSGLPPNYEAGGRHSIAPATESSTVHHHHHRLGTGTFNTQGRPWLQGFAESKKPVDIKEYVTVSNLDEDEYNKAARQVWLNRALSYQSGDQGGNITAPSFNLPASNSMLETQESLPITREEEAKQDITRHVLQIQVFDGSFMENRELLSKLFGPFFFEGVELIKWEVDTWIMPEHSSKAESAALACAIISLMTTRFQSCEPLWRLMVAKARTYMGGMIRADGCPALEKRADALTKTMTLPKYQLRRLDPRSITAQDQSVIMLHMAQGGSANVPTQTTEAGPQDSTADRKLAPDSGASVATEPGADPSPNAQSLQGPSIRPRLSLEFAPLED